MPLFLQATRENCYRVKRTGMKPDTLLKKIFSEEGSQNFCILRFSLFLKSALRHSNSVAIARGVQFYLKHQAGHYIDVAFTGRIGYHTDKTSLQTYCDF
jgi:hypothetical protein